MIHATAYKAALKTGPSTMDEVGISSQEELRAALIRIAPEAFLALAQIADKPDTTPSEKRKADAELMRRLPQLEALMSDPNVSAANRQKLRALYKKVITGSLQRSRRSAWR
jgi:hypothetical protein